MKMTALILALLFMLFNGYEAGTPENSQVLIGWDEESATPISADNPHYAELPELISAMDSLEQVERFDGARVPSGYIVEANGDTIEFGAYDEDSLLSVPAVEGYEYECGRSALYIKDKRGLRLYEWEHYLELDTLAKNAQYDELVGKTFAGRVKSNDPHDGVGYCFITEDYGEVCVRLIEPVFADEGELMEITILPQDEPLTRITPIYAQAVRLYEE